MPRPAAEAALQTAMAGLLKTRSLQQLTVGEVARAAGVSRVTFYRYYQDLYDLAGAVCAGEMQRVMGESRPDNWQAGLVRLMRLMRAHRALLGRLRSSGGWAQIERVIRRHAFRQVMAFIGRCPDTGAPEPDRAFTARFYERAISGLILDWAEDGMKEEPEALVGRLSTLLTGQLASALNSFAAAAESRAASGGPCRPAPAKKKKKGREKDA